MTKFLLGQFTLIFLLLPSIPADAQTVNQPKVRADAKLLIQTNKLTPKLVVAVSKVGEEKRIKLPRGTDILATISKLCGTANTRRYYLPLFLSANSSNDDIRSGRTILTGEATLTFPACVFADEKLATANTTTAGILWNMPKAVSGNALLKALAETEGHDGSRLDSVKWSSTAAATQVLDAETKRAPIPPQQLDAARLKWPDINPLPESLNTLGMSIVNRVDSARLEDNDAKLRYGRIVQEAIKNDAKSLNSNMVLQATAFERSLRTQDVMASNRQVDPTTRELGSSIVTTDFVNGSFSFTVREGFDLAAAATEINQALSAGSGVSIISDYEPYFEVASDPSAEGCVPAAGQHWPFDTEELRMVLRLRKLVERNPSAGQLLILDTGFPPGKTSAAPFSSRFFVRDSSANSDPSEPFLWSAARSEPRFFNPALKDSSHGVSVLSLALGGPDSLSKNLLAGIPTENGMVMSLMGYEKIDQNKLGVISDAVTASLSGANWGQAQVAGINLSLRFTLRRVSGSVFTPFFPNAPQVLFVFAAGNGPEDASRVTPAKWGGTQYSNVITVGASTPNDALWIKSNRSKTNVDIAAPGCGVPALSWDGSDFKLVNVNGTSFSAPLVSFAGNMLQEFNTAAMRKARILASGRFSAQLTDKVVSSRALDIPVAMATPFDAIRLGDGRLVLGHVEWPRGRTLCGVEVVREELAQIHRVNTPVTKISVVTKSGRGNLNFNDDCALENGQLNRIVFQPVISNSSGASPFSLGEKQYFDIRNVQSITFCDLCRFSSNGTY